MAVIKLSGFSSTMTVSLFDMHFLLMPADGVSPRVPPRS
jgi:hypothetical protein